jgi:hypothetical protein
MVIIKGGKVPTASEIKQRLEEVLNRLDETTRYAHLMRYLVGDKDVREGLAILTAWNPNAEPMSREENQQRQKKLMEYLRDYGFHYTIQKGTYVGQEEVSLIIYQISLDDALDLGTEWDQESIIHISRDRNDSLVFRLIYSDRVSKTQVVDDIAKDPKEMGVSDKEKEEKNIKRIQDLLDNFSELGGKLVNIGAKSKHDERNINVGPPRKYGLGFFGPHAREEEPVG